MSRAEDFHEGQGVTLSDLGLAQEFQGRAKSSRGTVRDIHPPYMVKVQRDGLQTADWYHCDFWKAIRAR